MTGTDKLMERIAEIKGWEGILTLDSLLENTVASQRVLFALRAYASSRSIHPDNIQRVIHKYAPSFSREELHRAYDHCAFGMKRALEDGFPGSAVDYLNAMNVLAPYIARDPDFGTQQKKSDLPATQIKKLLIAAHHQGRLSSSASLDAVAKRVKEYARGELRLPRDRRHFYRGSTSMAQRLDSIHANPQGQFTYNSQL